MVQNKQINKDFDTFFVSPVEEPHKTRCREIIQKHPEVKQLIGRNPNTVFVLLGVVALQIGIATWVGTLGLTYWWVAFIMAYAVGAFANHCLYVIIHEATHNLIFRKKLYNKISGVIADIPNAFPGALGFRIYHLKHHAHMGDHGFDADLPNHWEGKLVKNISWRKALWLAFFPLVQVSRSLFTNKVNTWDRWVVINAFTIIITDTLIIYFLGWNALLYLVFSLFLAVGLHPLGARWIQEHFTLNPDQETYSYYGPLNKLAMNVGYHNEHHDFPSIPWNRLPELRKLAPEYYNNLEYHTSWSKLVWDFIVNKEYSLYSRIIRDEEAIKSKKK